MTDGKDCRSPPDVAIDLVRSGTWTDRNKGIFLLSELTEPREAKMPGRIRASSLSSLREMANWRWSGHNQPARLVLGRIAGIEEKHLKNLIAADDLAGILDRFR